MNKKYFVCYYEWNNLYGAWNPNNVIVNEHPLIWLRKKYPDRNKKYVNDYPIKISFWQELGDDYVE